MIPHLYPRKGIHAREWISPAVTTYFIVQLTENAKQNMNLLDDLDWYFMPVHNPDGYVFTWEHVSNGLEIRIQPFYKLKIYTIYLNIPNSLGFYEI